MSCRARQAAPEGPGAGVGARCRERRAQTGGTGADPAELPVRPVEALDRLFLTEGVVRPFDSVLQRFQAHRVPAADPQRSRAPTGEAHLVQVRCDTR